ncbi:flagellin [Lutibaculum baratangense]|uniref:Flagellin n=1 Tax=Lutibaculum baratangense AMV1 TaxID=631454 RepID=V4RL26_9HYPH|nr:flagellin [Lutibaculum baratangense]ESR26766.1 flagellin domain protein [Lutibaculum baratangense AMV1]
MSGITLSAGVRQNLLSLQNTADLMSTTQKRLATGKEVNSALDNPTNFFTASSLQARSNDLNSLMDSMSNGIKTLEAADNGLTAITKTLESMQSTLRQARQDKSFSTQSFDVNDKSVLSLSGGKQVDIANLSLSDSPNGKKATVTSSAAYTGPAVAASTSAATAGAGARAVINYHDDLGGSTISIDGNDITIGAFTDATDDAASADEAIADIQAGLVSAGLDSQYTVSRDTTTNAIIIESATTGKDSVAADVNLGDVTGTGAGATAASATYAFSDIQAATDVTGGGQTINANNDIDAFTSQLQEAMGDSVVVSNDGTNVTISTVATGSTALASQVQLNGPDGNEITAVSAAADGVDGATVSTMDAAVDEFSVTYGNATANITVAGGASTADTLASINSQLQAAGLTGVEASFDDDGNLSIAAKDPASKALSITGPDASAIFGSTTTDTGAAATNSEKAVDRFVEVINSEYKGQLRASNDNGKLRIENLSTQDLSVSVDKAGDGNKTTSTIGGNTVRADLANQFNELRDQLDKLADDASFNGINLLRGDSLKITFNETGTSDIDIQTKGGKSINADTLKLSDIEAKTLDSDETIDSLLGTVKDAVNTIRSQSSAFGSNLSVVQNRQDFTKNMMNTLQTGADKLVLADTNEEAANMLALQTRQQLSSTALSMASQADQAALRLF